MAIVAVRRGVSTRQREAGLAMIHRFSLRLPVNKREISATVLTMAAHTMIASSPGRQPHGVHPSAILHALADLAVALHALEFCGSGSQVVAFGAIQRS